LTYFINNDTRDSD